MREPSPLFFRIASARGWYWKGYIFTGGSMNYSVDAHLAAVAIGAAVCQGWLGTTIVVGSGMLDTIYVLRWKAGVPR